MKSNEFKWHKRFLQLCDHIAQWSKDPSTKTGAVIVRPDKTVVSVGYNGFPRGIEDKKDRLNNREIKYSYVIHCEMNAILTAKEDLRGCTLYTTPFMSCDRCAAHVIQSGIARVVYPSPSEDALTRWKDSFLKSTDRFDEAGVEMIEVDSYE